MSATTSMWLTLPLTRGILALAVFLPAAAAAPAAQQPDAATLQQHARDGERALAEGRYADGIAAGTARVADIVRRNQTLTPEQRQALDDAQAEAGKSWAVVAALGMFVAFTAFHMGTGLGAIARLADRVEYRQEEGGKSVTARFYL